MSKEIVNMDSLDGMQYDVLKEISNIGASHAASALAKMLDKKISVGIPKVNLLEFKNVASELGGPEQIIIGLLVKLSGEINGIMMFLLDNESAVMLVNAIMGTERAVNTEFNEIELSAITEIGNILSSSYLSSLSTLTNLKIKPSVPYISIDMAGAILSVPAIEFGKIGDRVLFIKSVLGEGEKNISGYFLLVPEIESFNLILKSLGVV